MEFEWDENKNQLNIAKHGVGFDMAKEIFQAYILRLDDVRRDYGERRSIAIGGTLDRVILTVIYTIRFDRIRIISARVASRKERRIFGDEKRKNTK